jgi:hypothetical protein
LSNKIIRLSKNNRVEAKIALLTLVVVMHHISGYYINIDCAVIERLAENPLQEKMLSFMI